MEFYFKKGRLKDIATQGNGSWIIWKDNLLWQKTIVMLGRGYGRGDGYDYDYGYGYG